MRKIKIGIIGFCLILVSADLIGSSKKQSNPVPLAASISRGKEVYKLQCLACHQVDGGGVPHLNPPLDGSLNVNGKDKVKLIKIVLNGMTDRVEIEGEYYSNNMAPHRDLSDLQIADVLTYIRNSWTNKSTAVSSAEVKAVRVK